MSHETPILEYDPAPVALIEPSAVNPKRDVPERCVICFFHEVVEQIAAEYGARVAVVNQWEDGPHPLYVIPYCGEELAVFHPGVGAPIAAGLLEEVIAAGCRKFVVCGGCGVLEPEVAVGRLIVVSAAVRDEGVSYHYAPPSREIAADAATRATLEQVLSAQGAPFLVGKTWTTDAPYRETAGKIARRRAEGCVAVEMEAAALMAVAAFRGVVLGQVLYAGDDLSGEHWDHRGWHTRDDVRRSLFWLAAEACLGLP